MLAGVPRWKPAQSARVCSRCSANKSPAKAGLFKLGYRSAAIRSVFDRTRLCLRAQAVNAGRRRSPELLASLAEGWVLGLIMPLFIPAPLFIPVVEDEGAVAAPGPTLPELDAPGAG